MQCNPRIPPPPRDESSATAQGKTRDWLVVKSYTLYRGVQVRGSKCRSFVIVKRSNINLVATDLRYRLLHG